MSQRFPISGTYTDLYQLTMGQVYFLNGTYKNEAVFDYFFRKLPFGGGYVVFAGLADVLEILRDIRFTSDDIEYLASLGLHPEYLATLKEFQFTGSIYSAREGDVVFPNEPVLRVEAPMLQAQIIETLILNLLNFQSLIATKAARMRYVAGDRILSDFGLRRAQGLGGYHASRAAVIGGFDSTSNVVAAQAFGLKAVGTMAHSFIQGFDTELAAFRDFAEKRGDQCVLLVDTYDTLRSGIPNAITVAREMEKRSQRLLGIRLDSGDLAYLARQARQMLDDAGMHYVTITASNQLDEYVIKSLIDQGAPIDAFGVGTSLVTAPPDAALDGVYKLAYANGKPRIKLSDNLKKLTLPDRKQVYRMLTDKGEFAGADAVALSDETELSMMHHPHEPDKSMNIAAYRREALLQPVMSGGRITLESTSLEAIASYSRKRIAQLPVEYKRFENPHTYKVGLTTRLRDTRNELRNQYMKK